MRWIDTELQRASDAPAELLLAPSRVRTVTADLGAESSARGRHQLQ